MTAPAGGAQPPTGFQFASLFTERLVFSQLAPPEGGIKAAAPGEKRPVRLQLNVRAIVSAESHLAQTTLSVTALPDPHAQPYQVEVTLTGVFRAPEAADATEITRFAQGTAPVLLWPYVREMIHRVTADAQYGVLRLDPINATDLLEPGTWEQVQPAESV